MNATLFIVIIGFTLLLMAVGSGIAVFFFQRYRNPEPTEIQLRLMQLKSNQQAGSTLDGDSLKKLSEMFKETDYANEELGKKLEKYGFFIRLKVLLQQAGIETPPEQFFVKSLFPCGILFALAIVTQFLPLFLLIPLYLLGVYGYILMKKVKRYGRFLAQMPDALAMITSALRAGHSFQSALTVVSTEMPEPISVEFGLMVKDINLGIPVKDSLNRMMSRLDSLADVRMFATAVTIQREAGGNLAEVLENLGYTIRERFKLKGQISALTGQSRLTGYVLGAAPFILLIIITTFFYGYIKPLYETEMGHFALMIALLLQILGLFVIRKIIDIRI